MILTAFNRAALHHTNVIIRLSEKRRPSTAAQSTPIEELALLVEQHFKQSKHQWHVSLSPTPADEGYNVVYLSVPAFFADEVRDWLRNKSQNVVGDTLLSASAQSPELSIETVGAVKTLTIPQQRVLLQKLRPPL